MKYMLILAAVAALALPACSSPGSASNDPFRNAQGFAMGGQMAAHQQASLQMSGGAAARSRGLATMQTVPGFPSYQPFAR